MAENETPNGSASSLAGFSPFFSKMRIETIIALPSSIVTSPIEGPLGSRDLYPRRQAQDHQDCAANPQCNPRDAHGVAPRMLRIGVFGNRPRHGHFPGEVVQPQPARTSSGRVEQAPHQAGALETRALLRLYRSALAFQVFKVAAEPLGYRRQFLVGLVGVRTTFLVKHMGSSYRAGWRLHLRPFQRKQAFRQILYGP